MEVLEVGFDIDKVRFDVYRSRCIVLRMRLAILDKSLREINDQISTTETRLAYYDIQMLRYMKKGHDWRDPIREIEIVPSRSRA